MDATTQHHPPLWSTPTQPAPPQYMQPQMQPPVGPPQPVGQWVWTDPEAEATKQMCREAAYHMLAYVLLAGVAWLAYPWTLRLGVRLCRRDRAGRGVTLLVIATLMGIAGFLFDLTFLVGYVQGVAADY